MRSQIAVASAALGVVLAVPAEGHETARVSVDSFGTQANRDSHASTISADGQLVAFQSDASNLVPGDTNGAYDVFVHDRSTGLTTRVSVDSSGAEAKGYSFNPAISADGQFVAFESSANNLVVGDTTGWDVFVHDRSTGLTTRVSVDSSGAEGNDDSYVSTISSDGQVVAFESWATNLVAGDTNGQSDVFIHDRVTGLTELVSVDSSGGQGNDVSFSAAISADGLTVAFSSSASNLVA